jgi:hypothetical protein
MSAAYVAYRKLKSKTWPEETAEDFPDLGPSENRPERAPPSEAHRSPIYPTGWQNRSPTRWPLMART